MSDIGEHVDLESQQKQMLRARWRRFLSIIQAYRVFVSIPTHHKLNNLASPAEISLMPPSVGGLHALPPADSAFSSTGTNGDESSLTLPDDQVSIDVHLHAEVEDDDDDDDDDYCSRARDNAKLQRANIVKMVKDKDTDSLQSFGGVRGIAEALCTDLELGILGDEESLEFRNAGKSAEAEQLSTTQAAREAPRRRGLVGYLKQYCNNCSILLLSLYAVLSILFGIKEEGPKTGWLQGAIIIVAIFILILGPSIRDLIHERSQRLSEMHKHTGVLIRGGCPQELLISNVVVGDVVCLTSGSLIPGDGLFIVSGGNQVLIVEDGPESIVDERTPFLFYGGKVINGNGRMLITSVGTDTVLGELMNQVSNTYNETPLPAQLEKVGTTTQVAGISFSILILLVLFLLFMLEGKHTPNKHSAGLPELKNTAATEGIIDIIKKIVTKPYGKVSPFTTSLAILLVGIQEPIPSVVILAVAYMRKKMFSGKAYARELLASVTVGSVNIICAEKLYQPEVGMCYVGEKNIQKGCWVDSGVAKCVGETLCQCINTPILMPPVHGRSIEDPLLPWAASELGMDVEISRQNSTIQEMKALSSNEEGSGVLMRKDRKHGRYDQSVYWKGPATTILDMCSHYYDSNGQIKEMDVNKTGEFKHIVEGMHTDHLRTIAFAYKDIDVSIVEENNLTLIGIIGLKNACCTETIDAISACQNAGVKIIISSEDDVSVLENIARECGLKMLPNSDRSVLEGKDIQNLTEKERRDLLDKISVMGNSHPSDRLLLVQCLKKKGNVVAAVGDRTTASATLKEADVGVAMGIWSSEMARESSDIIIRNGNFGLFVSLISCGRCTYNNILKYIQLQLTMIISGTLISFITTVSLVDIPITAIQLILANFVVTLLGGLALLSEPPTDELMLKSPISPTEPFITRCMWRNILTQALYQTSILVTFHFEGKNLLGISKQVGKSIVFNSFVLCQVFNLLNSRDPEKKNVFKGLHRNPCFCAAVFIIPTLQVFFIEISHILVDYARLNMAQWGLCLLMGFVSLPIDLAVKLTASLIKIHPLLPNIGSASFTASVPEESTVSSILELPLIDARENYESTTLA